MPRHSGIHMVLGVAGLRRGSALFGGANVPILPQKVEGRNGLWQILKLPGLGGVRHYLAGRPQVFSIASYGCEGGEVMSSRRKSKVQGVVVALFLVAATFMALYAGSLREIERKEKVIMEMQNIMSPRQIEAVRDRLERREIERHASGKAKPDHPW